MSSGNFKYNRERAVEAGRVGGKLSRHSAADKSAS